MNAVTPTTTEMLTTHEMSRQFGVTCRLLRFYDEIGLLNPIRFGNERRFTFRDQAFLALIAEAQAHGLTLKQVRQFASPDRTTIVVPQDVLSSICDRVLTECAEAHDRALNVQAAVLAGGPLVIGVAT